jgi:hypothetical protein
MQGVEDLDLIGSRREVDDIGLPRMKTLERAAGDSASKARVGMFLAAR